MLISDHTDRHEGPGNGEAGCRDDRRVCVRQGQAVPKYAGRGDDDNDNIRDTVWVSGGDDQEENDDDDFFLCYDYSILWLFDMTLVYAAFSHWTHWSGPNTFGCLQLFDSKSVTFEHIPSNLPFIDV